MFEQAKELIFSLGQLASIFLGGFILAVSFFTFYWLRRRQFHRLNQLGVQTFTSYANMIWTRNFEYFIRLAAFAGLVLGGLVIAIAVIYG